MVEFGKRLSDECAHHGADWQRHCIDYGALKKLIEKKKNKGKGKDRADSDVEDSVAIIAAEALVAHRYHHEHLEADSTSNPYFRYALDREIEKAVLFVLQEQGVIATELDQLAVRRAEFVDMAYAMLQMMMGGGRDDGNNDIGSIVTRPIANGGKQQDASIRSALGELEKVHGGYNMAARSVLRFVAFVDLNVTAVRKILKKHDKITKNKLSHTYLSAYTNEYVDSHLDQLFNDGGLSSLVVTLKRAFEELHHVEVELLAAAQRGGQNDNRPNKHRRINSLPATMLRGSQYQHQNTIEAAPSGMNGAQPQALTHDKEPLLHMIKMSREKLKQNTKYVDIVAAQALMMFEDSEDDDASRGSSSEMTREQRLSSLLNLFSTFLYMTNYYIVAPTCGQYLLRVGSTESMAGIAIGMTPNAALIATVLYGWWSNHSYKSALIFAAACSMMGNVAYALALSYDSVHLVMIGRFLNGFGSARSINRRFIADCFSKRDRTAASAAFVTAGALGMACGPALAALLSQFSFSLGGTLWTVETAPGWIMLFLWSLFLVAFVIFFKEPDRSHIFGNKPTVELTVKNVNGENKPLLAEMGSSGEMESQRAPPLYKNVPVMTTLWVYFILKLVLECLMSSCPTLTMYYFGWDSRASGLYLAFLGLLMFPANMVVARLSHRYEDRELIYSSLVAILCSIVGFIAYRPSSYSAIQYMLFGICIFISTNALEGPNMSLLSKSIPRSWAKGIFNTGFLATEAGTAARSVGDVWITLASNAAGVTGMLNAIFVPMIVIVVLSVELARRNYDNMVEDDEDDVKSKNSNSD